MKKCPYCAEEIQDVAAVCRFCQHDLQPLPETSRRRAAGLGLTILGFALSVTGPSWLLLGVVVVFLGAVLLITGHWLVRAAGALAISIALAMLATVIVAAR